VCVRAGGDGSRPADRLRVAGAGGFSTTGENVAQTGGSTGARGVVDLWMGSQGHRDNMMSAAFSHIGVAHASRDGRAYWTMVLAGSGGGRRRALR
jgi:uncharacterized protein YkwD